MAERHLTERIYSRKTNDRKTNGRQTQDRADIWPKGYLTENCIQPKNYQNERNMGNKQLVESQNLISTYRMSQKIGISECQFINVYK